jgi:chaperone BCS1
MIKQFILLVSQNPVIAGSLGIIVSGGVLYLLKSLPIKLFYFIQRHITITLTVSGEDTAFDLLDKWLSKQKFKDTARTYKLSYGSKNIITVGGLKDCLLSPGYGPHFMWFNYRPLIIRRWKDDKVGSDNGSVPRECISITTISRNKVLLESILKEIEEDRYKNKDTITVYGFDASGYLTQGQEKLKRNLESVFIPKDQKDEIVQTATWYLKNKDLFVNHGIPYNLGFLFYGPPGTGKTSLAISLASFLEKDVYTINPLAFFNEASLTVALSRVTPNSVILFEDIDITDANMTGKSNESVKISLSALLNAIDGAAAPQDRILIMTTNNIEKLSPALIRPGRIDKQFKIDLMQPNEVKDMAESFFKDNMRMINSFYEKALKQELQSGATWQQIMLEEKRKSLT